MKLQLNAGEWATVAFFALAVTLGCYAEQKSKGPRQAEQSSTAADERVPR